MTDLDIATPLSTSGRFIVDAHGRRVRLAGVNWYGFHEDLGVAPGLDRTDRRALARLIASLGFNSVRLPFSLWMTEQTAPVPHQYLAANPDLDGATPMQVYDACVEALTGEGLVVIPNCHILDPGWCPVPATTQILTRSGWKYWPQVEGGDQTLGRASNGELQWTPILRVTGWGPLPVIRLGNARWSAVCTENHRWLMRSRRNRYVKGSGRENMVRMGPHWNEPEPHSASDWAAGEYQLQLTGYAEGGKNGCTPEQAAIIAWVLADGSCVYAGRGSKHMQACIYQKKEPQLSQIRALLQREEAYSSEAVDSRNGVTKLRLKKSYVAPLWEYFRVAEDLTGFVLGLPQGARRAWLDAWFAAEGWSRGSTRIIAQDRGPVFDAIALSVFLEGYMPGITRNVKGSFAGSKGNSYNITLLTKTIGNTRNCKPVYEAIGTEPVWCPCTALGTFVARDSKGQIFLTGNCSDDDGNGLWYNRRWPAGKFFAAWQDIATRYQANPLVAAMDIMNEPRRTTVGWRVLTPTWGHRPKTDVAATYTRAGNLIHEISPHVLIICEGLSYAADLTGVARYPVRLERPGQVVYSVHDYPWFHQAGQPRQAYFGEMRRNGGYLLTEQIAPMWIGEFGNDTRSLANFGLAPSPPAGSAVWWGNFQAWLTDNDVDWCWWALNPTQPKGTIPVASRHRSNWGDAETWGLLTPDWRGIGNPGVLDLLKSLMPPRTGPGVS
jgi:aryl-phospho-beta-D-glucosidase BglC (GH1 family)